MSRYSKEIQDGALTIAYGFDYATGYFFQIFDNNADPDDNVILDECSLMTKMTNGRMLELMQEHEVNEIHIDCVALDLPF